MKRRLFFILLAALSVVTVMAQGRKELRFNEIMVANDSSYMDQYGRHVPWVEVFNRSYGTVGMEQMFISNQPIDIPTSGIKPKDFLNDFAKKNPGICYEIPRGDRDTKVAPRTHVVFFADGNTSAGALHLSFPLEPGKTQSLYLYDVNGDLVDVVTIPANVPANKTFALNVDGQSDLAAFNAGQWGIRDGVTEGQEITPGKFNLAEQNDNIEAFHLRDSHGFIVALMAMSVVFSALLILYIMFKLFGKFFDRKRDDDNAAVDTPAVSTATSHAKGNAQGEVMAAIGMALYQHLNAHDQESGIITIDHSHENHSSWNSKLSTMGHMPNHHDN